MCCIDMISVVGYVYVCRFDLVCSELRWSDLVGCDLLCRGLCGVAWLGLLIVTVMVVLVWVAVPWVVRRPDQEEQHNEYSFRRFSKHALGDIRNQKLDSTRDIAPSGDAVGRRGWGTWSSSETARKG